MARGMEVEIDDLPTRLLECCSGMLSSVDRPTVTDFSLH